MAVQWKELDIDLHAVIQCFECTLVQPLKTGSSFYFKMFGYAAKHCSSEKSELV